MGLVAFTTRRMLYHLISIRFDRITVPCSTCSEHTCPMRSKPAYVYVVWRRVDGL